MGKGRSLARRRARRRAHAAQQWLLLLGFTIMVAIAAGWVDPARWHRKVSVPASERTLTMAEARASNAAVPIERRQRLRAAPFVFRGGDAARAQATECLATVALYEAGDDRRAQRAVMQVVLNRVGQPGFAKTVCGVVYQGADRPTGCQFSFACDGSATRRPEHLGWPAARHAARLALAGHVFAGVGQATNYHSDWLVPYWRDSLVKVARVEGHLFYERRHREVVERPVTE